MSQYIIKIGDREVRTRKEYGSSDEAVSATLKRLYGRRAYFQQDSGIRSVRRPDGSVSAYGQVFRTLHAGCHGESFSATSVTGRIRVDATPIQSA